ncbi:uncharacterized protein LOC144103415 [Amblyomma americanum]
METTCSCEEDALLDGFVECPGISSLVHNVATTYTSRAAYSTRDVSLQTPASGSSACSKHVSRFGMSASNSSASAQLVLLRVITTTGGGNPEQNNMEADGEHAELRHCDTGQNDSERSDAVTFLPGHGRHPNVLQH